MASYTDIILEARRKVLTDFPLSMQERFYRLYLLALNRALEKVNPNDVNEEIARGLLEDILTQAISYSKAASTDTQRRVIEVLRRGVQAHRAAVSSTGITASFAGVSREAFESLYIRRFMSPRNPYKSLSDNQFRIAGRAIERSLNGMILRGESWQRAAQRIVDGLTQGDPEIRALVKSMARKSKGLGKWLDSPTGEADPEAVKQARKIAYDARRIARTEPAHAFHEADRVASARSPVVRGIQWELSPRHPVPDICDVYAKHDFHGMGPGVYPPEFLPPLPHPHDLCFMTHVLTEPGESRSEVKPPGKVTASQVERYMSGTDGAIRRTVNQINRTSQRIIETTQ